MPDDSPLSTSTSAAPPTVREAVASYLEEKQPALTPDKLQVVSAALGALLQPAYDERVDTITPFRLVVLGGTLKATVSPKTGRPLASSTFRRYVLAGQEFWSWAAQKWPRAPKQPGAPAAEPGSEKHLGELVRILRVDAGLTRAQLGAETKVGEVAIKNIETGRQRLTRQQLDLLLTAPCMAGLIQWAEREGVKVELAEGGAR